MGDTDGTASGLNEPTLIGSGLTDAGHWWRVEEEVVDDPDGPLVFIKKNNGPERGLGHIRLRFDDSLHDTVGVSACMNGPKEQNGVRLCPAIGRIRHLGPLFDSTNDPLGGLPVTAASEVAGPVGGFGWTLSLDNGSPADIRIDQVEVDSTTPMVLAIPYPPGTSFSVSANAAWCWATSTHACIENFVAVGSPAEVRFSAGNTYHFDTTTNLLHIRIIMFPQSYTGDALFSEASEWHLWDFDSLDNRTPRTHALDRFSFNGITLPKAAHSNAYIQITADCVQTSEGYCANTPEYVEPEVCPSGYIQISYDKCCRSVGSNDCYDFTAPPTVAPTPMPTYDSSLVVLNPGFEDGLKHWSANGASIELDSEHHSGTHSVLVKDRVSTWASVLQSVLGRLLPDQTYRISCFAKLKNAASADLKMTLKVVDGSGTRYLQVCYEKINSSTWTECAGNIVFDVTGTLESLDLFAERPSAGVEYWVDDVSANLVTSVLFT